MYNSIDLIVAAIIGVLYYFDTPYIVDYLFEIFIAIFAIRFFIDFFFMQKKFEKDKMKLSDFNPDKNKNEKDGDGKEKTLWMIDYLFLKYQ